MMQYYVSQMIETYSPVLKEELRTNPINMDIVLEGGAFNGGYLTGCLVYLQELEQKRYINIHKISACSVSSLLSLGHFIKDKINLLEINTLIYDIAYTQFKKKGDMNIFEKVFQIFKKYITKDTLRLINNRLYITYYNIHTGKQIVICKYKSVDHLLDVVRRTCSFPFIIDKNLSYKNKYIDGLYPYVFPSTGKVRNQILYLNLHHYNYILGAISIKNEKTNTKRIFTGLIDIHTFFVHKKNTEFCSYLHTWSVWKHIDYYFFLIIINIFAILFNKMFVIHKLLNQSIENNNINMLKLIKTVSNYIIKSYCV